MDDSRAFAFGSLYENGEFHVGDSVEHIIAEAEKYTKELI